jgi:transposase
MNIRDRVDLSDAERAELQTLLRGGRHAARKLKRAQILLAADAGVPDDTMAQSLGVGGSTVYRTQRRFVEGTSRRRLMRSPVPAPLANSRSRRKHSS